MNELQVNIEEVRQLDKVYVRAQAILKNSPKGSLRVSQKKTPEFYWVNENTDRSGQYIKKCDKKLVEILAQKDYAERVCQVIDEIRRDLKYKNALLKLDELKKFHERLVPSRRELVEPFWLLDEEYIRLWELNHRLENEKVIEEKSKTENSENMYWGGADKYPLNEENGFMTERGELVCSKSEKILADKLYLMKIPYIYESTIFLNDSGYVSPDFVVLNIRTRQEYYWEHFGMMEKPEYCEKAIRKIASYEKNNIYVGKKLLVTYETTSQTLNIKRVESLMKEFLL